MFDIFLPLSFLPLFVFALIAILNALTFPRLKPARAEFNRPQVSVLIPMRNEAEIIAETVTSLLSQDYPNLEILLLDDHSSDGTAEIAINTGAGHPRLRVFRGEPLPDGWLGKVWACDQLSRKANGEYLLFADADVRWQPGAISALMAEATQTKADLLNAWTTQITNTWGERLIVPLMAFSIHAYLPVLATHHLPWKVFAAASGQCLLFRRDAYQSIGGHAAIRDNILDDMSLAYAIKQNRLRFRSVDANGFIHTRMYQNWAQVRDGFAKNILAGHGNNVLILLVSTVFHWWQFILPLLLVIFSLVNSGWSSASANWMMLVAISSLTRALTAAVTRQRIVDSIFLSVSVFLMTVIAVRSILWHFTGGPKWKGRRLTTRTL